MVTTLLTSIQNLAQKF